VLGYSLGASRVVHWAADPVHSLVRGLVGSKVARTRSPPRNSSAGADMALIQATRRSARAPRNCSAMTQQPQRRDFCRLLIDRPDPWPRGR
jgi:hypothetical protein